MLAMYYPMITRRGSLRIALTASASLKRAQNTSAAMRAGRHCEPVQKPVTRPQLAEAAAGKHEHCRDGERPAGPEQRRAEPSAHRTRCRGQDEPRTEQGDRQQRHGAHHARRIDAVVCPVQRWHCDRCCHDRWGKSAVPPERPTYDMKHARAPPRAEIPCVSRCRVAACSLRRNAGKTCVVRGRSKGLDCRATDGGEL